VSQAYDIVVIDTAPVLVAADAGILAPAAGTVFFGRLGERDQDGRNYGVG